LDVLPVSFNLSLPCELAPARDDDVYVERVYLHTEAFAVGLLASDESGSCPTKWIINCFGKFKLFNEP